MSLKSDLSDFNSYLHSLNHALQSLTEDVDKTKRKEQKQIVYSLSKEIMDLRSNNQNVKLDEKLVKEFKVLEGNIKSEKLLKTLKKVEEAITLSTENTQTIVDKPQEDKPKIELKLAIISDVDAPDHNGVMLDNIENCASKGIPFVASRRLILGMESEDHSNLQSIRLPQEKFLMDITKSWVVFENKAGGLLLFLPKEYFKGPQENNLAELETLDFDQNKLHPIDLNGILSGNTDVPKIEDFKSIFKEKPTVNKAIFLFGHGGSQVPAALEGPRYRDFIQFLDGQNCKALTVTSCFSGGKSSQFNMPEEEDMLTKGSQGKPVSFPIIVRSIGDMQTYSNQKGETDLAKYGTLLEEFVGGAMTHSKFLKVLKQVEGGQEKLFSNYVKVYFPHSKGVPGGFRPVGEGVEGKSGYNLTVLGVTKNQLEAKKADKIPEIEIIYKHYLLIHPLVVESNLVIKDSTPLFFSMVPGAAHHYVTQVHIEVSGGMIDLIKSTLEKHSNVDQNKAFFISQCGVQKEGKVIGSELENLVLYSREGKGAICAYRDKNSGKYYSITANSEPIEISSIAHARLFQEALESTKPEPWAVRASTGGQQTEKMFEEAIDKSFWVNKDPLREFALSVKEKLGGKTIEQQQEIIAALQLDSLGTCDLVFLLMEEGFPGLALDLIKQSKDFDMDSRDMWGRPLICQAIYKDDDKLIDYLLEKNVQVNVFDPSSQNDFPLYTVIQKGSIDRIKKFLSIQGIDVRSSCLNVAFENKKADPKEIISLLTEKGINVDKAVFAPNLTALGRYVKVNDKEAVKILLEVGGANPDRGRPSAMAIAAQKGNIELFELLLKHGGDPFDYYLMTVPPVNPFIDAIIAGHTDLAKKIFDNLEVSIVSPKEHYGLECALLYSLLFMRNEMADILLEKVRITDPMEWQSNSLLLHLQKRAEQTDDKELLSRLALLKEPLKEDLVA